MMTEQPTAKRGKKWILGLIIPAFVFLMVWYFFIGPSVRHNRLVEHGIKAEGVLIGVEETGTVVNDSPELELTIQFHRADGTLDTATTDFVPSLRTLHMFQEGVPVVAAYDSTDPEEITVVSLGSAPVATQPAPGAGQATTQAPAATPANSSAKVDSLMRVADSLRRYADSLRTAVASGKRR